MMIISRISQVNKNNLEELNNLGISDEVQITCVGGGRVNVNDETKKLLVYGYSQGKVIINP
jgi:hypothetical protein